MQPATPDVRRLRLVYCEAAVCIHSITVWPTGSCQQSAMRMRLQNGKPCSHAHPLCMDLLCQAARRILRQLHLVFAVQFGLPACDIIRGSMQTGLPLRLSHAVDIDLPWHEQRRLLRMTWLPNRKMRLQGNRRALAVLAASQPKGGTAGA